MIWTLANGTNRAYVYRHNVRSVPLFGIFPAHDFLVSAAATGGSAIIPHCYFAPARMVRCCLVLECQLASKKYAPFPRESHTSPKPNFMGFGSCFNLLYQPLTLSYFLTFLVLVI